MWEKIKALVTGASETLGVELPAELSAVTDVLPQAPDLTPLADAASAVTEGVAGTGEAVSEVADGLTGLPDAGRPE